MPLATILRDVSAPRRRRSARLLAAAAAIALLGIPDARARPGEIVRVERPRGFSSTAFRLCPVNAQGRLTCFGERPPEPGARFVLVDSHGSRGSVTARRIEPSKEDACQFGYAHDVVVDGDIGAGDMGAAMAIQGLGDIDGARVLPFRQGSPSGRDEEQVWMAIDRDRDDAADVLATFRDCSNAPGAPLAPAGKTVQGLCLDYWALRGGQWRQISSDVFFACR